MVMKLTKMKIAVMIAVVAAAAMMMVSTAYGFYYVHGDAKSLEGKGAIEVTAIIDDSANNGAVKSELLIMPEGSTVADVLDEFVYSNESKADAAARADYSYSSIADRVSTGKYRCIVSTQADRKPGADGRYGQGDMVSDYSSRVLNRYDNVAFIAE